MNFMQKEVDGMIEAMNFKPTDAGLVNKLYEEFREFIESRKPEEAADLFIVLLSIANHRGFDLFQEAKKKIDINKKRKWSKPNKFGLIHHIK